MTNPATMTVTRREQFQCALIMVVGMLAAYAIGLYTGTRFVKVGPPTAHVEVTSKEMEGKR